MKLKRRRNRSAEPLTRQRGDAALPCVGSTPRFSSGHARPGSGTGVAVGPLTCRIDRRVFLFALARSRVAGTSPGAAMTAVVADAMVPIDGHDSAAAAAHPLGDLRYGHIRRSK